MNAKFNAGMPMPVVLFLALAQSRLTTIASFEAERNAQAEEW